MTNAGYASDNLHMMKIKECCDVLGVSMYRLSAELVLPRKEGETNKEYEKRKNSLVWTRHKRGWEMMYNDNRVTMRAPGGAIYMYECDLDDFAAFD